METKVQITIPEFFPQGRLKKIILGITEEKPKDTDYLNE